MGTQKNRLNETVLLSTQNICSIDSEENIYNFTLKMFVLSKPMYNNTISVSNSLDPDQARFFGRLDLGSNCYQQTTKSSRVKVWCSDISATDVSATENVEGGRFVCMHKCVMHFIILLLIQRCMIIRVFYFS